MKTTLEEKARKYLEIKSLVESLTEELKQLDSDIKDEMDDQGIKSFKVDNKILSLIKAANRSFDASKLKDLVPPAVFKSVTETAVKTRLFDAALSLGKIKDEVVEQVVTKTPYSQLRIK